jgi:hypothetical protein
LIGNENTGYATFLWIIVPRVISQSFAERGDYRRRDPPERFPTAKALVDFRGGSTHAHFTVPPADRDFRGYQLRNVFHSPDDVEFSLNGTLTRFATSYLVGYVLDPFAPRTICLSTSWRGLALEHRPVTILKEAYLASENFGGRKYVSWNPLMRSR